MTQERVTVERSNVSPLAAKIMQTFFVDRCNDTERPNILFNGADGTYDEKRQSMVVQAELTPRTSKTVGTIAVERAFDFAQNMMAS